MLNTYYEEREKFATKLAVRILNTFRSVTLYLMIDSITRNINYY